MSTLSEYSVQCQANPTVHRVNIQSVSGQPISTLNEYSIQYPADPTAQRVNIQSVSGYPISTQNSVGVRPTNKYTE